MIDSSRWDILKPAKYTTDMNSFDCHGIAVFGQVTGTESPFSCLESGENISAHMVGLKQHPMGKSTKRPQKRVTAVVLTQLVLQHKKS